jgi:hypothetical protein
MFDEPIPLPTGRFRIHSDDPTFRVAWRGGSRFELSGEVSSDPSAELDVETPGSDFEVALAQHSTPEHAVAQLRRSLPRDVVMRQRSTSDGVEVAFTEALLPAAALPRLRIWSTDLAQRVRQVADNAVEFVGCAGADAHLTILCDRARVTVRLPGGTSARGSAARVGASMPHGYRALVDGAMVSVFKDADFFSLVA